MVAEGPWSVATSGGGKDIDPAGESDLSRQVAVGLEAPLEDHQGGVLGVLCTEGASRVLGGDHPRRMQLRILRTPGGL